MVGGTVFMVVALNCSPCSLSLTHWPSALSHSPAVTEGNDPMTVVSSRCPFVLIAEDTEAIFFVMESDALDDAGDFIRRRSAFRDCGIHGWGFIFPRTVRMVTKSVASGSAMRLVALAWPCSLRVPQSAGVI